MIPDEAIEAAANVIRTVDYPNYVPDMSLALKVLEAAGPHLMAPESARLSALRELADQWSAEGDERIAADSRYYGLRLMALLQGVAR